MKSDDLVGIFAAIVGSKPRDVLNFGADDSVLEHVDSMIRMRFLLQKLVRLRVRWGHNL